VVRSINLTLLIHLIRIEFYVTPVFKLRNVKEKSMPIRLTQVTSLGYAPAHVRIPPDTFGVSASIP
jgi:hypothetical protein